MFFGRSQIHRRHRRLIVTIVYAQPMFGRRPFTVGCEYRVLAAVMRVDDRTFPVTAFREHKWWLTRTSSPTV
jgi:hypothetical protein